MEHDADEIRQDAHDVLGDAVQWRHHSPANWAKVHGQVERLHSGIIGGDLREVQQATVELELLSPLRCYPPHRDPDATAIPDATAALIAQVQETLPGVAE